MSRDAGELVMTEGARDSSSMARCKVWTRLYHGGIAPVNSVPDLMATKSKLALPFELEATERSQAAPR